MNARKINLAWWFCGALSLLFSFRCQADVSLPKLELFETSYDKVGNVLNIVPESTLPKTISIELDRSKITGLVCAYAQTDASYAAIKSQLEKVIGQAPRIDGPITTVWRLEEKKCAVALTWVKEDEVIQIILRPIGKKAESK